MTQTKLEIITSTKNQHIQQTKELLTKKAARDELNCYVAEGVRLAEEALISSVIPKQVFYSDSLSVRGLELVEKARNLGSSVFQVSSSVMDSLSDTETSQGLLLVMPVTPLTLPATLDFVIVVDQLRDPGNLGTIIRSAKAAGVQAFFLTTGSVDVYSPKVIRSAMGAHFNLPILTMKWSEIHRLCLQQTPALKIVLAESENALPYWESDFRQPVALVIGGEANGPSEEVRNSVNENVKIPMPGGSESLNAAVAASILLFEVVRQRNQ